MHSWPILENHISAFAKGIRQFSSMSVPLEADSVLIGSLAKTELIAQILEAYFRQSGNLYGSMSILSNFARSRYGLPWI